MPAWDARRCIPLQCVACLRIEVDLVACPLAPVNKVPTCRDRETAHSSLGFSPVRITKD
jgi:hypothetical protein